MADLLTTTLVLMYFVTPPAKIPLGEPKAVQESNAVWMLQSTSHIETPDSTTCFIYAKKLFAAINPVNTMTLRAYCLCPHGDGDKKCYAPTNAQITELRGGTGPAPTIQGIGPDTPLPKPPPPRRP